LPCAQTEASHKNVKGKPEPKINRSKHAVSSEPVELRFSGDCQTEMTEGEIPPCIATQPKGTAKSNGINLEEVPLQVCSISILFFLTRQSWATAEQLA